MIYDHIENRSKYSALPGITKALDCLAGITADNAPTEKTYLDGDKLIINPLAFATKPAEDCFFEAHHVNADVHFILTGEESISIAAADDLIETKAYSAVNDTALYDGKAISTSVMRPGYFMVCFPHDVHRTGESVAAPCDIRKLVVKVNMF